MCWKTTMKAYVYHGLPYMVSQYLREHGVKSAGCFDTERGSHGVSFYADEDEMEQFMKNKDHETYTHKLFFGKNQYKRKFYCSCIKKH